MAKKKRGSYQTYTLERKGEIIDVFLRAIAAGWTTERFCRVSGVRKSTLLTWVSSEESIFDRYRRAMETKNLALPERCDDIVNRLINPPEDRSKQIDHKTAGVVLRHLEFRLMREYKGGVYREKTEKTVKAPVADLTDEQIDEEAAAIISLAAERAKLEGR